MISVHLYDDYIETFGHAKVGLQQAVAVCGFVSMLMQAIAIHSEDKKFVYQNGYSKVRIGFWTPVGQFAAESFIAAAAAFPRNLTIIDHRI